MRKGEKFVWNEEREKSFEELKRRLVSSLVLTLPSGIGGYQIYSDASKKGLGCVLMQHADVLSRKNSGTMACLKIQPEIIKDLELMEVELVVHGSEGYIASLKIEPNLILQIKEAQKKDGELWSVVQNMKKPVLSEAHSSPFFIHLGSTKMYRDLKQNFWWNGMKQDVTRFVAKCLTCQQVKIEHQRASGLLQPLDIPTWKWDQISMDFVTGLPRIWIRGSLHDFGRVCRILEERDLSLDKDLYLVEFAYNNSWHASIKGAPFELLCGRKCRSPICWSEVGERVIEGPELVKVTNEKVTIAKEKLKEARSRQKSYADRHRRALEFKLGDRVFLKVSPCRGV
nr:hypothetical protein [Tanacetum cinerariifolium]